MASSLERIVFSCTEGKIIMPTKYASRIARLTGLAVLTYVLAFSQPVLAQSEGGPVLKDSDVTEANLLRALAPTAAASAVPGASAESAPSESDNGDVDVQVGTRSLLVTSTKSPSAAALAPKKKASASLLITFETNSAALTPRSMEQLDVVAAALKNDRLKDFSFVVEGHADARGNPEANMALSLERAESVRSYLVTSQNVPESKLRAVGKGDTEPMNAKDLAAPENRRVTIVTDAQ
jgi:OOP family OmpA-OmpF porin